MKLVWMGQFNIMNFQTGIARLFFWPDICYQNAIGLGDISGNRDFDLTFRKKVKFYISNSILTSSRQRLGVSGGPPYI